MELTDKTKMTIQIGGVIALIAAIVAFAIMIAGF
jgi:hypothetical protein